MHTQHKQDKPSKGFLHNILGNHTIPFQKSLNVFRVTKPVEFLFPNKTPVGTY